MSEEIFDRLVPLFGADAMDKLQQSHVAVFGLGGVGSYVVEALVRGGVGTLTVVDGDRIVNSNCNRQLYATSETVGQYKTALAKERALAINPSVWINEKTLFFDADALEYLDFAQFDYVVDAIDTVTSKVLLATTCQAAGVPVVSCMSAGNKVDAQAFAFADLYQTKVCPLCKVMRKLCREKGVEHLTVLYSRERPVKTDLGRTPASCSFVPPVAGLLLAGFVLKNISGVWGNGVEK